MTKVVPGKAYTAAEIGTLVDQQTADHFRQAGYILRLDANSGTFTLVPVTEAYQTATGSDHAPLTGTGGFAPLPPIIKRTPQQRVDSLTSKWIPDSKASGRIPGLKDETISGLAGQPFETGRTEVTDEVIRDVARSFLQEADDKHEAKLAKQITRHED